MTKLEGLAETRDCYCLAARREARAITRLYDEALRDVGLKSTQFSVLAALAQMGSSTLTPLADLLGAERTTLTRSTRLLEEHGLLETVESDDAREHRLQLTPAGLERLALALPLWRGVQRSLADQRELGAPAPATGRLEQQPRVTPRQR